MVGQWHTFTPQVGNLIFQYRQLLDYLLDLNGIGMRNPVMQLLSANINYTQHVYVHCSFCYISSFTSLQIRLHTRDVNGTRISRVPKIFPVPGKKISRTGIFGKSMCTAYMARYRSQLSVGLINVHGHAVWLTGSRTAAVSHSPPHLTYTLPRPSPPTPCPLCCCWCHVC